MKGKTLIIILDRNNAFKMRSNSLGFLSEEHIKNATLLIRIEVNKQLNSIDFKLLSSINSELLKFKDLFLI